MKTKGLEPIVAAVLLIVVAVIGAVLVYLWFSGYVTRATSQAEQLSAAEQLKIEAIEIPSAGTVRIYVRNVGTIPIDVASAYVLNAITLTTECGGVLSTAVNIPAGDADYADATGCSLNAGERYIAKVVTKRGTEAAAVFIAS